MEWANGFKVYSGYRQISMYVNKICGKYYTSQE